MASQQATSAKNPVGVNEKQLRKIWSDMSPSGLLERLRAAQPAARWSASGNRITGCCPYHDDRTPSFQIYLDRCYAKCFGCGQFVWNPVDLWAMVHGLDPIAALLDLKLTFNLSFITTTVTAQFTKWQRHQAMKSKIARVAHEAMIEALNSPEDCHPAMLNAVKWLVHERKLPLAALPALDMLGIMPPVGRILDALDEEAASENASRVAAASATGARVDLFTSYADEARVYLAQVTEQWVGTVLFRYDIAPSSPGRLKLRRPQSQDFIFLNDPFVAEIGFFGLGWERYNHLLGPRQRFMAGIHLVEGEFDALSLMGHQVVKFGGPRLVAVASGGSSTASNIDTLYVAGGVEEVYLFGDAPIKHGHVLIDQWLPNITKLRAKVFCGWDKYPSAGDPDEAVLHYGVDAVVKDLNNFTDRSCFQAPQEWALERAAEDVASLDDSELRKKVEIAAKWGTRLKNDVECDAFIDSCARAFNLPPAGLRRHIVAMDEDEPAYGYRLANLLQKEFFVIGQESTAAGRVLWLWHRKKKSVVKIILGDENCIETELAVYFGPLFHFFNREAGIPAFMQALMGSKEGGPWLPRFNKAARQQLSNAFMHLVQEATDMSGGVNKGAGIHVMRGADPEIYVVNGKSVYYGTFSGEKLAWQELEGPSHNGNIFDAGVKSNEKAWMRSVSSAADLTRADTIDLRSVYDRLATMLNLGWMFKHHDTAVQFMAAHLMAASIGGAFKRQPMVGIHAESSSGKSRLLMGLIGGKGFPKIHVLSAAVPLDHYTAASVRQHMADKARPLALDEFEHEGAQDRKTKTTRDVLEMFRNLTGEDNTVSYGSRGGKAVTQTLSMFVFVAAITKPEKVQDANRMVSIELVKGDRDDPVSIILGELGEEFVSQLRDDLEVALLPHIKQIQIDYEEVAAYFAKSENRPQGVESRYMEALLPALTVMKLVGLDYKSFAGEFCTARAYDMVKTSEQSEAAQLFSWLLDSPQIVVRSEVTNEISRQSLLSLLGNTAQRANVNNLSSGLYYDEAQKLLLVNWTQAVQTVLRQHPRYSRDVNIFNLREIANRHETALKPLEIQQCGVVGRLRKYGIGAFGLNTISVFRLSKVMDTFEVEGKVATLTLAPVISINKDTTDETPDFFGTV